VRIAVICMVANMVMNLILIWPLQHVGLALATSLSSMLNTGLLLWGLHKAGVYRAAPGWPRFIMQLLTGCALMVTVVLWLNAPVQEWLDWGWQHRVLEVSILVVAGMLAFVAGLLLTGLRMRDIRR
jgi:putative peptidoglycan lipid II flippase